MYTDFRNINREGWKYTYTGKDLADAALKKFRVYKQNELELRAKMALALKNPEQKVNDKIMKEMESDILDNAVQREHCMVFVHEFSRTPEREFHLSIGDVVYFDLAKEPE